MTVDLTKPHKYEHEIDWYCICGLPVDNPLHIPVKRDSNKTLSTGKNTRDNRIHKEGFEAGYKKFNAKRFMALAKKIEKSDRFFTDSWIESYDKLGVNTLAEGLRARQMEQFMKENPLVLDDEIEERFERWLAERR